MITDCYDQSDFIALATNSVYRDGTDKLSDLQHLAFEASRFLHQNQVSPFTRNSKSEIRMQVKFAVPFKYSRMFSK